MSFYLRVYVPDKPTAYNNLPKAVLHESFPRGSPDTITLQVPVAKCPDKTLYEFRFWGPKEIDKGTFEGVWKIGDTSIKECKGEISVG